MDCSKVNWFADSAKVALWNHQASAFNEFTLDSSGYYVAQLSTNCTSFNVFRGSALNWDNKWNQSGNGAFEVGKNLMIAEDYSDGTMNFSWGVYDKGFTPEAPNEGTIYLKTPNEKTNYYVYTYESFTTTVDGITISVEKELNGAWNTNKLVPTTKTYYNPANLTSSENSYGVLKASFNYNTLANVGVIISAVQHTGGTATFQTKNIVVGASADNELELVLGAYYYGTNDWNLWDNFGYDATNGVKMGKDAGIAYDLDKADICNLSKSQADALRSEMDGNEGYVEDATWDGHTYEEAYKLVNKQCTTPNAASISSTTAIAKGQTNTLLVIIISSFALVTLLGFGLMIKRRKEDR